MPEIIIRLNKEENGAALTLSMSGIDPVNAIAILEMAKQRIIDRITKDGFMMVSEK